MVNQEKLQQLRNEKHYSQLEIAQKAGISVSTYNKIETLSSAKPRESTMKKIAEALGVAPEELNIETKVRIADFPYNRGIYGIFTVSEADGKICRYIGKSEELPVRARNHYNSIINKTTIASLCIALDDPEIKEIVIQPLKEVPYKYDQYARDAMRLATWELLYINRMQRKCLCLEQLPEGRRPSFAEWDKMRAEHLAQRYKKTDVF